MNLRLFVAIVVAVRLIAGLAAWELKLYPQSAEDLARYWFLNRWWHGHMPHAAPDGSWHFWIKYTPGLPLVPLLLTPFVFLGTWQGPALALMQGLMAGLAAAFAGLAAREASGRDEAAWLAAAVATAWPPVVMLGFGFLSEPTFLAAVLLAAWGLIRWREEKPLGGLLLSVGIVSAQLTRYEGWTLGAMMAVVAVVARGQREAQRGLFMRFTLLVAAVPLAWMALNWVVTGSPTYFLSLTKQQYNLNIGEADRAAVLVSLLRKVGAPIAALLLVAATAAWRSRGPVRLLAVLPLLQAAQITLLQLTGSGAAHYPERLWYGVWVLAAPIAGVVLAAGLERLRGTVNGRMLVSTACAAIVTVGVGGALVRPVPYSGRELLAVANALLQREASLPAEGPLVYVLVDRDTFDMTAMQLIVPDRWESPLASSVNVADLPASVRVLAVTPGSLVLEDLPAPARMRLHLRHRITSEPTPWEVYWVEPLPDMPGL